MRNFVIHDVTYKVVPRTHNNFQISPDVSEVFNISKNTLSGSIPESFKDFIQGNISLGKNDDL